MIAEQQNLTPEQYRAKLERTTKQCFVCDAPTNGGLFCDAHKDDVISCLKTLFLLF